MKRHVTVIEAIFNSNLFQMAITFLSGFVLYVLFRKYRCILDLAGYLLSFGIFFSFIFNIGEIYNYTDYYKRAFFVFGDEITTVIVMFFCYVVLSDKKLLSVFTAASIIMSGGKTGFLLLLIMIIALFFVTKDGGRYVLLNFSKYIMLGIFIYYAMFFVSDFTERIGANEFIQSRYAKLVFMAHKIGIYDKDNNNGMEYRFGPPLRGAGACKSMSTYRCFVKQSKKALLQRYYTSLVGLWMTMEGGFRGDRYPKSSDEFADLIIKENPWGMNERYGLNWFDWKKMGAAQNPYLRFGSGYGPCYLGVMVIVFLSIAWIAVLNICRLEKGPATVFSMFLIVNVLFNQTQPWTTSGSRILTLLGFCSFHILVTWLSTKYRLPELFLPFESWRTEKPGYRI
jgi:hypothetical protein